jgi:transposase
MLTPGQDHDLAGAERLLENANASAIIADKAYDADALIDKLMEHGVTPVIPPKANRKDRRECDFALYCERNLIERFFNKVKYFRGIARNYLAAFQLVATIILLN